MTFLVIYLTMDNSFCVINPSALTLWFNGCYCWDFYCYHDKQNYNLFCWRHVVKYSSLLESNRFSVCRNLNFSTLTLCGSSSHWKWLYIKCINVAICTRPKLALPFTPTQLYLYCRNSNKSQMSPVGLAEVDSSYLKHKSG